MVGSDVYGARRPRTATVLGAFIAVALLVGAWALLWAPPAQADGISVYSYQVDEEFWIEVDEVGDASCRDVLTYDAAFFNKAGFNFDRYPFLISRRYREPWDIREIQNFNAEIDTSAATITVTFDQPGKAYNQGVAWEMYGFYTEPKFEVEGQQVFEQESTVNNEFTLWNNLEFKTTTYVKLPEAAQNVHWDGDESALVWELPHVPADLVGGLVFARNRDLFLPLAVVLLVGGLAGAAILLVRRSRRPTVAVPAMQPAAALAADVPTDTSQASSVPETMAEPPLVERSVAAQPSTPEPVSGLEPAHRLAPLFCRHCGESLCGTDSRFCPMCGKPVDGNHQ